MRRGARAPTLVLSFLIGAVLVLFIGAVETTARTKVAQYREAYAKRPGTTYAFLKQRLELGNLNPIYERDLQEQIDPRQANLHALPWIGASTSATVAGSTALDHPTTLGIGGIGPGIVSGGVP